MRKVAFLLFITSIVSIFPFFPEPVYASCAGPLSLQEYRKQADIVVTGTATIVVDNDAFISVTEYYKGRGPETIRVTGKVSEKGVSSIDFPLVPQKKYLLFLKFTNTDELQTTACSGNKELGEAGLSAADKSALGKSKITPVVIEKLQKQTGYELSRPAIVMMIISGGIIFVLLLLSVWKIHKRSKKNRKPKGKKKK